MSSAEKKGLEPWAWLAFALGLSTVAWILFLGWKPGGRLPILVYLWGPFVIGGASAVALLAALIWSARRRPALQRGRIWPLGVLAASLWFCSLPIAYPSSHEGRPSAQRFRLPFEGAARVHFGGEQRATNRLLFDPARRFGLCFEPVEGTQLGVVAPAAGTLVEVRAGRAGELLVLAVGAGEFCHLEGLEPGSCPVPPGAAIAAGDALGLARGLLFVHLQDGPEPGRSEGIPMRFWNYLADGRAVEVGSPVPPQDVGPALQQTEPLGSGR